MSLSVRERLRLCEQRNAELREQLEATQREIEVLRQTCAISFSDKDEGIATLIRRAERAEEQLEADVEAFRLIAQRCGEDGTEPDDWRAMTFPGPREFALRAVGQLRSDYDEALRAVKLDASNPATRPDYPCDCGPDEYCASDECHGAVSDPAKRPT